MSRWSVLLLVSPISVLSIGAVVVIVVALCRSTPKDIPTVMITSGSILCRLADRIPYGRQRHPVPGQRPAGVRRWPTDRRRGRPVAERGGRGATRSPVRERPLLSSKLCTPHDTMSKREAKLVDLFFGLTGRRSTPLGGRRLAPGPSPRGAPKGSARSGDPDQLRILGYQERARSAVARSSVGGCRAARAQFRAGTGPARSRRRAATGCGDHGGGAATAWRSTANSATRAGSW